MADTNTTKSGHILKIVDLGDGTFAPATVNVGGLTTAKTNSSASCTRPNDTTAYSASDVVGTDPATNMTFANITNIAGSAIEIVNVSLRIDVNAVPAGVTGFRLHLYDAAPTAIADNGAFNLIAADRAKYLGWIDIDTPVDLGDTLYVEMLNINKQIKTVTTSIYGVLQTIGAFTPTALVVKTIELQARTV